MIQFGDRVKDCITGFSGVAIERLESIVGHIWWFVQPTMDAGEWLDGDYFEEERLMCKTPKELAILKGVRDDPDHE